MRPCPLGSQAAPGPGSRRGADQEERGQDRHGQHRARTGKKPEPGPFAPQYVYDFSRRRGVGHAEQQQQDRPDLVGAPHAATS